MPYIALIVTILIIYAGVQIIFSNGNEETLRKLRKTIIFILIGLFVLAANFFIVNFFLGATIPASA
jgi:divalent metal cation (Fe/Co/Zn/Cd) transporter